MAHMPNIAREAAEALFHHPHPHATQEGTPMTALATLNGITASLAQNKLVEQLVEEGLGLAMQPDDVAAVVSIARTVEGARRAQQPLPQRVPQPVAPGQMTTVQPAATVQPQVTA